MIRQENAQEGHKNELTLFVRMQTTARCCYSHFEYVRQLCIWRSDLELTMKTSFPLVAICCSSFGYVFFFFNVNSVKRERETEIDTYNTVLENSQSSISNLLKECHCIKPIFMSE